eukprot:323998_1
MATRSSFSRTKSTKETGRSRQRFRAHSSAHSSDYPPNISINGRSKSQRRPHAATPTVHSRNKYKMNFVNKQRSNSVGKKNKSKRSAQKVTQEMINAQYLTNQSTKVSTSVNNIQNTIEKLKKTEDTLKQDLHHRFEHIRLKIKQQQLSLEQELEDIVKTKTDILHAQMEELKHYNDQLTAIKTQSNNVQIALDFFNQPQHQKYNIPSIQSAVSSNIIFEFDEDAIDQSISEMGLLQSGEVPLYPPIIKAINKSANSIQVKCFPPKKAENQVLEITKYEIEYILLPKQYKTRWKKMKKSIFEVLKDGMKRNKDDEKEAETRSNAVIIENHKNFKRNVMFINDLEFNCDYLIRARCYNVCGFGPWSVSPKLITIYPMKKEGHWEFEWEALTDNMSVNDSNKTVTKTAGKKDWDCVAKGPCFPINVKFIESQMKIYWDVRIEYCHSGDTGSLHFGIMHKKVKPQDVWNESIGFAEYESMGMEIYKQSPTFENGSVVRCVVDFKLMTVQFYQGDALLAQQKLTVLKQKISDLCFGVGSYRKKNSITLM